MVSRPHRSIHSTLFCKKVAKAFHVDCAEEDIRSSAYSPFHKRVAQPPSDQSASPRLRSSGSGSSGSGSSGSRSSGSRSSASVDDLHAKYKAIMAKKKKAAVHSKEDMHHTYQTEAMQKKQEKPAVHHTLATQTTRTSMVPESDDDMYAEFLEYKKMHQLHKQQVLREAEYNPLTHSDRTKRLMQARKAYIAMYPDSASASVGVEKEEDMYQGRSSPWVQRTVEPDRYTTWDAGLRQIKDRNAYEAMNSDAPRAYLGVV